MSYELEYMKCSLKQAKRTCSNSYDLIYIKGANNYATDHACVRETLRYFLELIIYPWMSGSMEQKPCILTPQHREIQSAKSGTDWDRVCDGVLA